MDHSPHRVAVPQSGLHQSFTSLYAASIDHSRVNSVGGRNRWWRVHLGWEGSSFFALNCARRMRALPILMCKKISQPRCTRHHRLRSPTEFTPATKATPELLEEHRPRKRTHRGRLRGAFGRDRPAVKDAATLQRERV